MIRNKPMTSRPRRGVSRLQTFNRLSVTVVRIDEMTDSVKRFTLVRSDGGPMPPFHPGAYTETFLPVEDRWIRRSYSLCSSAEERYFYQIAVHRRVQSRGGSAFWHERVKVGQSLEISLPVNHFALSKLARHHVFVAGGIGITPFLSMMTALEELGNASFELHFAAKSASMCPFYDWLRERFNSRVTFYFSDLGVRLTHDLLGRQKLGTHVYLCGPTRLMSDFRSTAKALGYPQQSVHYEAFVNFGSEDNRPFRVHLARQGMDLEVAKDQTLLDALRAAQVEVASSCEVGGCGTCLVHVLQGEVEHRDFYLSEEEQEHGRQVLCCVSRAKGETLVLDL